jgi:hypothetical protein
LQINRSITRIGFNNQLPAKNPLVRPVPVFVAPHRGRDNLEKATVGIQKTDKSAALEQLINTMLIAGTIPDDDNAQPAHTIDTAAVSRFTRHGQRTLSELTVVDRPSTACYTSTPVGHLRHHPRRR